MFAIIYSILSYALFLLVYSYFALFSDGALVPRCVDVGEHASLIWALVVNVGLLLIFGLQHSVMARSRFKRFITRAVPEHVERATFVLASSLALVLLMAEWRPFGGVLWNIQHREAVIVLWIVNALGWLGVPVSSFLIDHFDLFGVKQTLSHFRRASVQRQGFVTPLFYKYVRHPMMTSLLIGFWVTPHMTASHLLLSLGMTAYVIIGVHFEERALLRELGDSYARYRATTPKFLPLGTRIIDQTLEASSQRISHDAL